MYIVKGKRIERIRGGESSRGEGLCVVCQQVGVIRWRWWYIGTGWTRRSVGRMHVRVCVHSGGGKGLVSRRGGMKSGYRAEANGIIHPPPPPRPPFTTPCIRSTITITSSNYNIVPFPIYIIYTYIRIYTYILFSPFSPPPPAPVL